MYVNAECPQSLAEMNLAPSEVTLGRLEAARAYLKQKGIEGPLVSISSEHYQVPSMEEGLQHKRLTCDDACSIHVYKPKFLMSVFIWYSMILARFFSVLESLVPVPKKDV